MYEVIDKYRFSCAAGSIDSTPAALSSLTAMFIQSYPGYANGEKMRFPQIKSAPHFCGADQ